MIETELGNLRRSHYSDQINPSMDGSEVTIMGWVLTVRGHGNISFATIKDKNGSLSVIAKKGDCSDEIREKISSKQIRFYEYQIVPNILFGLKGKNTFTLNNTPINSTSISLALFSATEALAKNSSILKKTS